jgi:hypothetical protein
LVHSDFSPGKIGDTSNRDPVSDFYATLPWPEKFGTSTLHSANGEGVEGKLDAQKIPSKDRKMKTALSFLSLLLMSCATAPKVEASLNAVDTFGSERISAQTLESDYGDKFHELGRAYPTDLNRYVELSKEIEASLRDRYQFAIVKLSLIQYFDPPGKYLTVDVVETRDVERRMPFFDRPTKTLSDPDGVLALWLEYAEIGMGLLQKGEIKTIEKCPTWHCLAGFDHPQLKDYLPRLNEAVRKNQKQLLTILREEKNDAARGDAAYLLAHLKDSKLMVKALLPAIKDPSSYVRNNVLRVLSDVAFRHPEVDLPVRPFIDALNFPETTDRNKASAVLASLSRKEGNKEILRREATEILQKMAKLRQPNNRDHAEAILKNIE